MKDTTFYIEKADELIKKVTEYQELDFESKMHTSLEDTFNEIELLFYGYSENYPTLLDMKMIKERGNIWVDPDGRLTDKLIVFLSQFKSFIQDYRS